ncbi:hypothetical protein GIB67_020304, partial [Kingdonia uniflora]
KKLLKSFELVEIVRNTAQKLLKSFERVKSRSNENNAWAKIPGDFLIRSNDLMTRSNDFGYV